LSNQKSPFLLWFSRFDEQGNFRVVDHYDLVLTTSPAGSYQPSLVVFSNSSREVDSTLFVDGSVENVGSVSMDSVSVYVTFYKQSGDVLAVSAEGSGGLSPNETAYFSVSLSGFNEGGRLEEFDRYDVAAEGYDNSLWTADGQLISPEVVYVMGTPEATIAPLQPESFPYFIYIIAVIVVAIIIVGAVLFFKRSKNPTMAK
jgi:hypothetical protein